MLKSLLKLYRSNNAAIDSSLGDWYMPSLDKKNKAKKKKHEAKMGK